MKEPKRFDGEKYKRMLALSESVKAKRPVEGEVINLLIIHVDELYEYIDYLREGDCALDDDALERLGVPEAKTPNSSPARSGNNNRRRRTGNRRPTYGNSNEGWQAPRTDLSYLDGLDDSDDELPF